MTTPNTSDNAMGFLLESSALPGVTETRAFIIKEKLASIYQQRNVGGVQLSSMVALSPAQLVEFIGMCRGRVLGKLTGEPIINHALDQVKAELRDRREFLRFHCTNDAEFIEMLTTLELRDSQEQQEIMMALRACVALTLAILSDSSIDNEEGYDEPD